MKRHNRKLLGSLFILASILLAHFLVVSSVMAQTSPETTRTINFSARLKSADGKTAPDGNYNVRFRLYTASKTGNAIWSEAHYDENGLAPGEDYRVQVTNGYLNAKLGSRTPFSSNIPWDGDLWLTMEIGGKIQAANISQVPWDGEMLPRIELNAVPYAMNAGALEGKRAGDFIQLGQGRQTNTSNNPSIQINTTGEGRLIQLERNSENVFTVDNSGNISFGSGSNHTIAIDRSSSGTDGKTLAISGGDGGAGDTNGGNVVLQGGSASGSGASGLVVLATTAFATATNDANCYAGGLRVSTNCTVTQSTVDNSSAVMLGFSTSSQSATLPDPTLATPGRILYIMAANDSEPFSLIVNSNESISMQAKTALTMLWNGSDWAVAGHTGVLGANPQQAPITAEPSTPPLTVETQTTEQAIEIETPISEEEASPPTPDTSVSTPQALQLDDFTTAPTAAPGSMYYDSTLGKVQCYEAAGWGACGDAPDTFVAISPEYKNAVMNGTDIGIISSDFCSGTLGINDGSRSQPTVCAPDETFNFYRWTTEEEADQTRSIYLTYQLPDNFKSFIAGSSSIMGRTDNDNANVAYQVYRDNGSGLTSCGSAVPVSSGNQSSWQRGLALDENDPAACDFEAGDSVLFRINLTARNKANAYVSNVNFIFRNS